MLSKRCTYGLRAVLFLAARKQAGYVPIRRISECLAMPYPFLAKVLQALTRQGLLQSLRGPRGGVALARPAADVTLKEVIAAIDGPDLFEVCVLGLPGCGTQNPCPLHERWKEVRGSIHTTLENTSVEALAQRMAAWQRGGSGPRNEQDLAIFSTPFKTLNA